MNCGGTTLTVYCAERALEAPIVRRIFSSSPRDPRYHMLSHISAKFAQPAKAQIHEPRAALFLNRFTRTLTIMYATSGLKDVIGIPADSMRGRSFYYCIAQNCLQDAVKCLENAKGNDSIAYLRFWFRDPRIDDPAPPPDEDSDEEMTTEMSEDTDGGGVNLRSVSSVNDDSAEDSSNSNAISSDGNMDVDDELQASDPNSRTSSGDSINAADTHEAIFGSSREAESSRSSLGNSPERRRSQPAEAVEPVELEAVISCTSDGLVVCLRKARPMIPHPTHRPSRPTYENGLFAAPWAAEPMLPSLETRSGSGFGSTFAPSLGPQGARRSEQASPLRASSNTSRSHDSSDFMAAIRDQAIFAWALTGINGSLAEFGHGRPSGESLPRDGLPVWESDPRNTSDSDSSNGWHSGQEMFGSSIKPSGHGNFVHQGPDARSVNIFGDPGLDRSGTSGRGSTGSSTNGHSASVTPLDGVR